MRYAIITNTDTVVYSVHDYVGGDWPAFKAQYEADHQGQTLIDLGTSTFPAGQGWSQETGGIYPPSPQSIADVLPNIMSAIRARTEQLEYSGTVTYAGQLFPRDHATRDDVVLLATAVISSPTLASALLPLQINALDGAATVVNTVADAEAFALAMLSPLKAVYSNQANQLAAVRAMTTITELCQYIDPR